MTDMKHANGNI